MNGGPEQWNPTYYDPDSGGDPYRIGCKCGAGIDIGYCEANEIISKWNERTVKAQPRDEWHEDYGDVLWWTFPVEEPPYCGSPLDTDWPDYHTHWTPLVIPVEWK